ncbi:dTDP-glucose 4,6-dehydratase [hydrothermal vent metagenome]|uniref:dTDP-glucose 4,6-dehydratase n=1 Tax=hydrothermal vent metagenome TaxID=652676 RepID=A0A3B1BLZ4_9ZZZZ
MKILVTGAAGFIGGHYVLSRLKNYPGDTIVSLDKLTYAGNLENLASVIDDPRHQFVKGDIADSNLVEELFDARDERFDAVINFAAESHVDRSIDNPDIFLKTNTFGTFTLLEAVRRHGVGAFIQVSTDEVYGSLGLDDPSFTETTPIDPSSPYSASKASADFLALSYYRTYQIPVIVTRCSNNYGSRQFPEKLIPLFINNLLNDKQVPIYGSGENARDWIHVRDHCAAINLILEKGKSGEVYNIGGQCEKKNIEIADNLIEMMGKDKSLKKFVTDRPGHDFRYSMDISKIESELGWRPAVKFEKGLKETVDWYKNNPAWLEKVTSGAYRDYYNNMYKNR